MPHPYHWIQPLPEPASDVFAVFNLTRSFHQEVEAREARKRHCEWYRALADKHQREIQAMQRDPNLLGWFIRRN